MSHDHFTPDRRHSHVRGSVPVEATVDPRDLSRARTLSNAFRIISTLSDGWFDDVIARRLQEVDPDDPWANKMLTSVTINGTPYLGRYAIQGDTELIELPGFQQRDISDDDPGLAIPVGVTPQLPIINDEAASILTWEAPSARRRHGDGFTWDEWVDALPVDCPQVAPGSIPGADQATVEAAPARYASVTDIMTRDRIG